MLKNNKQFIFLKLFIGVMFLSFIITAIGYSFITSIFGAHCGDRLVDDGVVIRRVIESTTDYQHLWDYDTDFLPRRGLQVLDTNVVFSDGDCDRIVSLNMETGDQIWTTRIIRPRSIVIDHNQNVAYVFGSQHEELVALNDSGERLWTNDILWGQRVGISPYVFSDGRVFSLAGSLGFVSVNPDNGEFGSAVELPNSGTSFSYIGEEYLWLLMNDALEAREIETSEVIWRSEYDGFLECCLDQVESTPDVVLVHFHSELFALDKNNGDLLWAFQDTPVISNIDVSGNQVAFLDENAELHILDVMTGDSIANIAFTVPEPEALRFGGGDDQIRSSLIAYENDIVIIYFGDTAYLSAYEIIIDD